MSHNVRLLLVAALAALGALTISFVPPIPQSLAYHNFADQRAWLGVPNFLNVISNLPFLLVGLLGSAYLLFGKWRRRGSLTPIERWPYLVLFLAVALTCFGSAYYHLHPDNDSLVWDRLPMAIGFMGLLSAVLAEHGGTRLGSVLLLPLVAVGIFSVLQWHLSEIRGAGDLRFYVMVQFFSPVIILLLLALFPAHYTRAWDFVLALGVYTLAKVFESLDRPIYTGLGHLISGHTLKHLAAAGAIYVLWRMLRLRQSVPLAISEK